ncbi:MAG: hypothetical protein E5V72_14820 [Mesorhizobium sp.]|uniref:hypothetical protein n=1 Tax=Mesorhizobium sp. TaxID=1871066 RepID=UPI000FE2B309|nr:hypothetical protein [Mesorhizobium sp.]RWH49578.1 MAG: hypothetical protein EOQ80_06635 [Mesorhizobium sp.]RWH52184.1 MAG: hypothetical protein EOQ82_27270 [Mesorhizobium sp.]RWI64033.1 MAG: hypothetical protein EOR18_30230 [Mesorhizobium sp.]RWI74816.1 MAG: hypothetical protein EOR19_20240 [Mesorhizobium sp.]RWJ10548.1 MAG: hypothetical protein EOR24_14790 [Mesorhizobium sp.]
MSIITARAKLLAIADRAPIELGVEIIDVIENEMFRAPPIRKARRTSSALTEGLRRRIKRYAHENPDATFHEIATHHNVSIGRVSEALNDKYPNRKASIQ